MSKWNLNPSIGFFISAAIAVGFSGCHSISLNSKPISSIALTPSAPMIQMGTSLSVSATATYTDSTTQELTTDLVWTSTDSTVATVSKAGIINAIKVGNVTIVAAYPGSSASGSVKVVVNDGPLTQIRLSPATMQVPTGSTQQFAATGIFADQVSLDIGSTVTWSSSDPTVASISTSGLASGLKTGVVTITATDPATHVSGTALLGVTSAVLQTIAVTISPSPMPAGTTAQAVAVGTYTDGSSRDISSSVIWSSSNALVATISTASGTEGKISSLKAGSITIQALDSASNISGTASLKVSAATLAMIQLSPANAQIPSGTNQPYLATGIYSDNTSQDISGSVTWSSSNSGVASIASNGMASGLQSGVVTITAMDPSTSIKGTAALAISTAVLTSISVSLMPTQVPAGVDSQAVAVGNYSDGSTRDITSSVTWSSTSATIASVSTSAGSNGRITTYQTGLVTLRGFDSGTGISGSANLVVSSAALTSIRVNPGSSEVPIGVSENLTATGIYSDNTSQDITSAVIWSSSNSSLVSGDGHGGFTGTNRGLVTITATDPATSIAGTGSITVMGLTLTSIRVVVPSNLLDPTKIPLGQSIHLSAIGIFSDGSSFNLGNLVSWTSSNSAALPIWGHGWAQAMDYSQYIGQQATLTATWSGSGFSGSGTMTLTLSPVSPVALTFTGAMATVQTVGINVSVPFNVVATYSDGNQSDVTFSSGMAYSIIDVLNPDISGCQLGLVPPGGTLTCATPDDTIAFAAWFTDPSTGVQIGAGVQYQTTP